MYLALRESGMLPHDTHDTHARLSVVEATVKRMESTLDGVASDVSEMRSYQDRQRGAFAVIIITAGAIGAAVTKAAGYLAAKAGIA
jgi:hypothetical protein